MDLPSLFSYTYTNYRYLLHRRWPLSRRFFFVPPFYVFLSFKWLFKVVVRPPYQSGRRLGESWRKRCWWFGLIFAFLLDVSNRLCHQFWWQKSSSRLVRFNWELFLLLVTCYLLVGHWPQSSRPTGQKPLYSYLLSNLPWLKPFSALFVNWDTIPPRSVAWNPSRDPALAHSL